MKTLLTSISLIILAATIHAAPPTAITITPSYGDQ